MSAHGSAAELGVFVIIRSLSRQFPGQNLKLGDKHIIPNFLFIIILSFDTIISAVGHSSRAV
jgi:hypothetical protein